MLLPFSFNGAASGTTRRPRTKPCSSASRISLQRSRVGNDAETGHNDVSRLAANCFNGAASGTTRRQGRREGGRRRCPGFNGAASGTTRRPALPSLLPRNESGFNGAASGTTRRRGRRSARWRMYGTASTEPRRERRGDTKSTQPLKNNFLLLQRSRVGNDAETVTLNRVRTTRWRLQRSRVGNDAET